MDSNHNDAGRAFAHFGEVLRYARTSFGERVFNLPAGVAPPELTSRRLIACLAEHDYPISSGAFSSLEAGNSLPRDPERFLRALFVCLGLSPEDELGRLLTLYLAQDLLRRDLGKYAKMLDEVMPEDVRREMLQRRAENPAEK